MRRFSVTVFANFIVPFLTVLSAALFVMNIGGYSKRSLTSENNNQSVQVESPIPSSANRGQPLLEIVQESHSGGRDIRDQVFLVYIGPCDKINRDSTDRLATSPEKIGQEAKKAESNGLAKIENRRIVFSGASGEVQVINATIPPISRYALAVN